MQEGTTRGGDTTPDGGTIDEAVRAATEEAALRGEAVKAASHDPIPVQLGSRTDRRGIKHLHLHPRASEIPKMPAAEFEDLVTDIRDRGIVEPIQILEDGTIVDGRHRWRAAKKAGRTNVPCVVLRGYSLDEVFERMLGSAVLRRHLSPSQRVALAAKLDKVRIAKFLEPAPKATTELPPAGAAEGAVGQDLGRRRPQRTREAVAAAAGVSHETARQALDLEKHAPDLLEDVVQGKKTVHAATQEMKRRTGRGKGRKEGTSASKPAPKTSASGSCRETPLETAPPGGPDRPKPDERAGADGDGPVARVAAMVESATDLALGQAELMDLPLEVRERLAVDLDQIARLLTQTATTIRSAGDAGR